MRKIDLTTEALIIRDGKMLLLLHAKLDKWLPPGGHIEPNETPDESVVREVKEETGLEVEFVHKEEIPGDGHDKIVAQLALPFYANVHDVGDHDHACLFYLCRARRGLVSISHESRDFRWVTLGELLGSEDVPSDIREIGRMAFGKMEESQRLRKQGREK